MKLGVNSKVTIIPKLTRRYQLSLSQLYRPIFIGAMVQLSISVSIQEIRNQLNEAGEFFLHDKLIAAFPIGNERGATGAKDLKNHESG